jgi:YebC/PmpR family DNA-binding regulatory protein
MAIAARSGTDPSMNPALAMVIEKAKAANMPTTNIERAIKRVSDKANAVLHEIMYEGYGPAGVAVLVECATDNLNRSYPEIKLIFSKAGGSIAEMGAVAFQFKRRGLIRLSLTPDTNSISKNTAPITLDADLVTLEALDAGADDVSEDEQGFLTIYTDPKELGKVRDALKSSGHKILEAELIYDPQTMLEISDNSSSEKIFKLLDQLEEHQDVVNVYSNFEMA